MHLTTLCAPKKVKPKVFWL